MNILSMKPYDTRTLANVLLDLSEARRENEAADNAFRLAASGSPEEDDAADRMNAADDRIDALRAEFASMFRAQTGVEWSQVERAIENAEL
jgi:hypothetical protein